MQREIRNGVPTKGKKNPKVTNCPEIKQLKKTVSQSKARPKEKLQLYATYKENKVRQYQERVLFILKM